MKKHTGESYEGKAHQYAESVDSRPWNAYYERPGVISQLPPLTNLKVLDAGCGSGWYAEYLLEHGASVVAFDFNADFVQLSSARVGSRAQVLHADLAEPLIFARDADFDLVVCPLVMHYLRDWQPTLREFHRVLKPRGALVLSTHHPFLDWQYFKTKDYFAVDLLEDEWDIGKINFYRRPLTTMSRDLDSAGFDIERILEPQPTEEFKLANPKAYEHHMKHPLFLVIRARKNR